MKITFIENKDFENYKSDPNPLIIIKDCSNVMNRYLVAHKNEFHEIWAENYGMFKALMNCRFGDEIVKKVNVCSFYPKNSEENREKFRNPKHEWDEEGELIRL